MAIGYEIDRITKAEVEELERKLAEASPNARYAAFRTRLFYGNLYRWQGQGYHFNYMTFEGKHHCTCGLYWIKDFGANTEQISSVVSSKLQTLKIDDVQSVKGHLNLDDFSHLTIAPIVEFLWDRKIGDYLWTAFCQECGESIKLVVNSEARAFAAAHDASCGGGVFHDFTK